MAMFKSRSRAKAKTLQIPTDTEHLVSLLEGSDYLNTLLSRSKEQTLKNGRALGSLSDLCHYYASCCRHLTGAELTFANDCIAKFYAQWPHLPVPDVSVYVIAIKEGAVLEFGSTSFTIGSVILLHASHVGSCKVVCHEYVHVLERLCRAWFNANVVAGFRPVQLGEALDRTKGLSVITNPDDEVPYSDENNDAVFYTYTRKRLQPVIVNLLDPSKHARFSGDSVVERYAVDLTEGLNWN
jgi:hypothetical protein